MEDFERARRLLAAEGLGDADALRCVRVAGWLRRQGVPVDEAVWQALETLRFDREHGHA